VRPALLTVPLLCLSACRRDPPPPSAQRATTSSADAPASSISPVSPASSVDVLSQGREPRAPVAFAFVPGRREARVLEIDTRLELGDRRRLDEHVELRFDLLYATADTIELTLRHARTTAPDIRGIESTVGAVFTQTFDKDFTTAPPKITFPPGADGTARQYVEGAVTQIAASFLPPFPAAPIGEGARWRWGKGEGPVCELVSRRDGRLVVEETTAIHGPRRVDTGKVVQVNEDQTMRIDAAPDGIARRIEATIVVDRERGTKRTTHLRFEAIDRP
jgi:hypothetical protein